MLGVLKYILRICFSVRRKEHSILSPVNCWNLLLLQVKRESRDHATLSDLYLNNIIPRFAQISEDSGRLFKKVTPTQTHTDTARLHLPDLLNPCHVYALPIRLSSICFLSDLLTDDKSAAPQARRVYVVCVSYSSLIPVSSDLCLASLREKTR